MPAHPKRRPSREEIHRVHSRPCVIHCPTCQQRCRGTHSYNHRADCCGEVTAHIITTTRQGELVPHVVQDPNRAGYVLDPKPRTTRPAWAPELLPLEDHQ